MAFNVDLMRGGVGIVLRDFDGQFVAGFAAPVARVNFVEHVEVTVVLFAMQFVLNNPLESNSLIMVKSYQFVSPNLSLLS